MLLIAAAGYLVVGLGGAVGLLLVDDYWRRRGILSPPIDAGSADNGCVINDRPGSRTLNCERFSLTCTLAA